MAVRDDRQSCSNRLNRLYEYEIMFGKKITCSQIISFRFREKILESLLLKHQTPKEIESSNSNNENKNYSILNVGNQSFFWLGKKQYNERIDRKMS